MVFVKDDNPAVRKTLGDLLTAIGVRAHFPDLAYDSSQPTKFLGGFKCALLELDRAPGQDDAVDEVDLLHLYQPTLPVAFLYANAGDALLDRARALGPVFHKPDQLAAAVAWAERHIR
jgi:CheY-like chemotaxis protein